MAACQVGGTALWLSALSTPCMVGTANARAPMRVAARLGLGSPPRLMPPGGRYRCGKGADKEGAALRPRLHQIEHAEKLSPAIFKQSAVLPFEHRFSSRLHECPPSTLRELCGPWQRGVSFRCQSLDDTPCLCFHDAVKCFMCVGLSRSP